MTEGFKPSVDTSREGKKSRYQPKLGAQMGQHYQPTQLGVEKKGGGGKAALIAILVILLILGIIYGVGVAAFSSMFMPNTTLDGQNVSWKLASDVSSSYSSKVSTYQTQVTSGGLTFTLRGQDFGLTFDSAEYESGTIGQQDAWAWPLHILESHTITPQSGVTYDEAKLKTYVEEQVSTYNQSATQPVNATIAFDEASQAYAVVPEQAGTALDSSLVLEQVESQLGAMPTRIATDDNVFVQASVKSDDASLTTAVENANRYLTANIPLTMNGQAAGEITRTQISGWIVLGDDLSATIDETKLAAWVKTEVGEKYDTLCAQRTYTRGDGKQITVTDSGYGNYGWVTNEAELVSLVSAAIKSGSTSAIDIPTKQTASTVPDAGLRDWGNRYIDIDLTEQHVRMYGDDGSLIWESDCVTGNLAENHGTPTGVYQLNSYRQSGDVELRGQIDPETNEPEYISHVSYWMPFIANSWALHDADWRSTFGGSIYKTNGSHGCVNLPPEKAAALFDLCKVGDVVIVHN